MQIRLTEAEFEAIEKKFRNSGLKSRSEFIRTMIFQGYIVHFNEAEFSNIYKLIGNMANNINQIAVRVNSGIVKKCAVKEYPKSEIGIYQAT